MRLAGSGLTSSRPTKYRNTFKARLFFCPQQLNVAFTQTYATIKNVVTQVISVKDGLTYRISLSVHSLGVGLIRLESALHLLLSGCQTVGVFTCNLTNSYTVNHVVSVNFVALFEN